MHQANYQKTEHELSYLLEDAIRVEEPRHCRRKQAQAVTMKAQQPASNGQRGSNRKSRTKEQQQLVVPVVQQFTLEEIDSMRKLLEEPTWQNGSSGLNDLEFKEFRKQVEDPALSSAVLLRLIDLYNRVKIAGGIVRCLAVNLFKDVVSRFRVDWNLKTQDRRTYLLLYVRYLLKLEMDGLGYRFNSYCPLNLGFPEFFETNEFRILKRQNSKLLEKELLVLELFDEQSRLDQRLFTGEYLQNHFGFFPIETRLQSPTVVGFKCENLWNKKGNRTIAEYLEYQHKHKESNLSLKKSVIQDYVEFAVNIDMLGMPVLNYGLRQSLNVIEEFQYLSEYDGLSYLDSIIEGCNVPQMYMKVKGCWTGGHQENASLASVNINHGPGESEWLALSDEHVPRLRIEAKKEFNIDIHKEEGLWFPDIYWLILRNYPVKRIVQKKGDLVYSGPGTMHWVRALSNCIQTAWNVMPKTQQQLESSKRRISVNEQIRFPSTVIPFKSLTLKILNHEYLKNPAAKLMEEMVESWLNEEAFLFSVTAVKYPGLQASHTQLQDCQTHCEECKKQIFQYYSYEGYSLTCLKCTKNPHKTELFVKFRACDVRELLNRAKSWRERKISNEIPEVRELCNGRFTGIVSYCSVINGRHAPDNKLILETTSTNKLKASGNNLRNSGGLNLKLTLASAIQPNMTLVQQPSYTSEQEVMEVPAAAFKLKRTTSVGAKILNTLEPKIEVKMEPGSQFEQRPRPSILKNNSSTSEPIGVAQQSSEMEVKKQVKVDPITPKVSQEPTPQPCAVQRRASPRSRSRNKDRKSSVNSDANSSIDYNKQVRKATKNQRGKAKPTVPTAATKVVPTGVTPILVGSLNQVNHDTPLEMVADPRARRTSVPKTYNQPSEAELNPAVKKALKQKQPRKTKVDINSAMEIKQHELYQVRPHEQVAEVRPKRPSNRKVKPNAQQPKATISIPEVMKPVEVQVVDPVPPPKSKSSRNSKRKATVSPPAYNTLNSTVTVSSQIPDHTKPSSVIETAEFVTLVSPTNPKPPKQPKAPRKNNSRPKKN